MGAYPIHMSLRKLLGLLLAFAVLLAPSAAAAEHMAATPHHAMQMMQMGHCEGSPVRTAHDKAPGKSCCVWMCMAVAVSPEAPLAHASVRHAATYFGASRVWHGLPGETATPPPRSA